MLPSLLCRFFSLLFGRSLTEIEGRGRGGEGERRRRWRGEKTGMMEADEEECDG